MEEAYQFLSIYQCLPEERSYLTQWDPIITTMKDLTPVLYFAVDLPIQR